MIKYVNLIDVLTHNLNETTSQTIYQNWQKYFQAGKNTLDNLHKSTINVDLCFRRSVLLL